MIGPTDFLHPLPAPYFQTFLVFMIHISYIDQIINCLMPTVTDVIPILLKGGREASSYLHSDQYFVSWIRARSATGW
jgi:hypothetical protein